ncbi:TrpB-like pyridoxal-phosphate dependent enzyme [Amycolatopsis coloradensis]|uniref:tryptophan synthase n=1 Tax=Amycolatopsis coloradensis TaxID=76021 RepID=A0A1R0KQZ8_9PSEU|nr:TrpB-like pyridoxal phosphate-dependent enzyme [Amycolatopsis coloradensis]OLZ50112.1 TrpB-like pyridoxal-phosphate dependent enzyme [Amycolatopsis coloradensis]
MVPHAWYNALPDLGLTLPPDVGGAPRPARAEGLQVPASLLRQEMSTRRWITIPEPVREHYLGWRPTPLRRAPAFERSIGTKSRIYYKYEGGNLSGSHKLNTALAQAYYYKKAGARCLTVGTGAGQWGTAMAAACSVFGLECRVYMVRSSAEAKPYRPALMRMLGAEVISSPSPRTEAGRRALAEGDDQSGSLAIALAEAVEDTTEPHTHFCAGSAETYSLLHQTVIGLEAIEQLTAAGEHADVVVASLGAGSNLGGLVLPFLSDLVEGGRPRCLSVESTACPKLTRGRYAYDYVDASGSIMQKMFTLGSTFVPPDMHAGGLRYHGTAKLVSSLYDQGLLEARAYGQRSVFTSAAEFARCEGVLPAPESAHAVHAAAMEARRADDEGREDCVVLGLSGHGLLDLAAYDNFSSGAMVDAVADDAAIARALARLPSLPGTRRAATVD